MDGAQILLALLTIIGSVIGSVAAVSFRSGSRLTKLDAAIEANAKAIGQLATAVGERATLELTKGLQAQIDRHDRQHVECDTKIASTREEFNSRLERQTARLENIQTTHAAESNMLATAVAELKTGLQAVRDSMDRLATESTRSTKPSGIGQSDILAILGLAVQAAPLVRQMLSKETRLAA